MRIAPEVAEALAGGRPVVALESTLISHGLPRPRNLASRTRSRRRCARRARCPATIAVVAGEARVGLDEDGLEAIAAGGDVAKCGVRDLPWWRPAAVTGRPRWRPRRGSPRARGSRCSPRAGSAACTAGRARPGTSRPTWRRSRASASRWCARGQVDPRRRGDARAARDARRDRARLRHRPLPRLLPARLGATRCRGGSTRRRRSRRCWRHGPSSGTDGPRRGGGQSAAGGGAARPGAARPRAGDGTRGRGRRRGERQGGHPVPARPLPPRDRGREPGGQRAAGAAQRAAGGARSPPRRRDGGSSSSATSWWTSWRGCRGRWRWGATPARDLVRGRRLGGERRRWLASRASRRCWSGAWATTPGRAAGRSSRRAAWTPASRRRRGRPGPASCWSPRAGALDAARRGGQRRAGAGGSARRRCWRAAGTCM